MKPRVLISLSAAAIVAASFVPVSADAGATPAISLPVATSPIAQVLAGTVPTLEKVSTDLGKLDLAKRIRVALPLTITDQAQMDSAVYAEYQAGSTSYHHFLTPKQFGTEFGAPLPQVSRTVAALQSLGLKVATPKVSHLYVDATGTVALLEKVFGVTLDNFKMASGRTFYGNTGNITLPSVLNGLVSGVIGLDTSDVPQSQLALPSKATLAAYAAAKAEGLTSAAPAAKAGGASPCPQALSGGGYVSTQLATGYNFNGLYAKGLLGQGMTAALVEFDDYHDSNVKTVESCYGLTTPVVRKVIGGGTGAAPAGGEDEDMADIGTILQMLPKLKRLDVYVAPITGVGEIDLYGAFAADDKDPVLSSSWGNCEEFNSQADNRLFADVTEQAAAQGQQILQAAGDSGAVDCRGYFAPNTGSISVMQEASVPWVTAVGGTDLGELTANGASASRDEDTWNDSGAGGGGVSTMWAMPPWQSALKGARTAPGHEGKLCGALKNQLCREVPDISVNADDGFGMQTATQFQFTDDVGSVGYSIYCATPNCALISLLLGAPLPIPTVGGAGGWLPVGGTSLATPLTAAAVVLWDQEAKKAHLRGIGLVNPALYRLAANPSKYARDFHDITTDSNDDQYDATDCPTGCNPKHLYQAGKGYDMATGLGSYDATALGKDIVGAAKRIELSEGTADVYGYTKGKPTTSAIAVSSGYRKAPYKVKTSVKWLHATKGTATGKLSWYASPKGLKPGTRKGTITLKAKGSKAVLTVVYQVTKPAKLKLPTKVLHFSERIVDDKDATTAPTCDNLYNDELYDPVNDTTGTKIDASTLQNLVIKNAGPKGSALHWEAFPYSEASFWLGTDLDKGKLATQPGLPLVSTAGTIKAGGTHKVPLASVANANAFDGLPRYAQGTYHGVVGVVDLARPGKVFVVKAVLKLGNGKGAPTVEATKKSYSVTVKKGSSTTFTVKLTGGGKCGYAYSLSTASPYLVANRDYYSGTLAASGAAAGSGSDTGAGAGEIPVTVATKSLKVGKHKSYLYVESVNAEPNPLKIPVVVHVKK